MDMFAWWHTTRQAGNVTEFKAATVAAKRRNHTHFCVRQATAGQVKLEQETFSTLKLCNDLRGNSGETSRERRENRRNGKNGLALVRAGPVFEISHAENNGFSSQGD